MAKIIHHFIYSLGDPRTGEVRYIGKTSRGMARVKFHMTPSERAHRNHKAHWLNTLVAEKLYPEIRIIEEFPDHTHLSEAEQYWIERFRSWGAKLTNATDGGEGSLGWNPGPEWREKRRQAMLGKQYSLGVRPNAETRRRLSESHKGKTTGPHSRERAIKNARSQGAGQIHCSNGQIYQTQAEAARALGLKCAPISAVVLGKRKQHHGYRFWSVKVENGK